MTEPRHSYPLEPPVYVRSQTTTRALSITAGALGVGLHLCTDWAMVGVLLCALATLLNLADLLFVGLRKTPPPPSDQRTSGGDPNPPSPSRPAAGA